MERNTKKGFTLMEMLIVVAIIAVLVAIAIPSFSNQLEKSREAVDLANVRGAYAELNNAILLEDESATYSKDGKLIYNSTTHQYSISVPLMQRQKDWQTSGNLNIGGIQKDASTNERIWNGVPNGAAGQVCVVRYTPASVSGQECMSLNWGGVYAEASTRWNFNGEADPNDKTVSRIDGNYQGCLVSGVSQLLNIPLTADGVDWTIDASSLADSPLAQGYLYTVGIFELSDKKEDGKYDCYRDSGEFKINNGNCYVMGEGFNRVPGAGNTKIQDVPDGTTNVNVAIQLFKRTDNPKKYYQMTDAETTEVLKHLTVTKTENGVKTSYNLTDFLK